MMQFYHRITSNGANLIHSCFTGKLAKRRLLISPPSFKNIQTFAPATKACAYGIQRIASCFEDSVMSSSSSSSLSSSSSGCLLLHKAKLEPFQRSSNMQKMIQHRYTSSSSSSSNDNGDPIVTITKSSNDNQYDQNTTTVSQQQQATNQPQRKKSSQQIAEEELYNLLSESKQHYQHANYKQALSTAHTFLTQSTNLFGPNHPAVASAHNNIGLMNKMIGEYNKARTSYHEALSIYAKIVGEDHENYAATLHNLGVLDKTQAMMDEELKQIEKMTYVDRSVEYFEKALGVREVELGVDHVYTVSSRSNLGNAIAAQVIMSETMRLNQARRKMEKSRENEKKQQVNDRNGDNDSDAMNAIISTPVSKFTTQKWELAEKNLREALRISIDNPRGEIINIDVPTNKHKISGGGGGGSMKKGTARQRKMMAMKNNEANSSNNEQDNKQKEQQQDFQSSADSPFGLGDTTIRTMSSALAAQNLAVFLKTRADLISSSEQLLQNSSPTQTLSSLDCGDMYAEAKNLYIGALRVRTKLKGDSHPDTVASKFSLAELIDTLGDEDGANKLRQELLNVYDVEERDEILTEEEVNK